MMLPALPEHAASETDWQNALLIHLPEHLPLQLWRQNSGRVRTDHGSVVTMAPKGAADIVGFVIGAGTHLEIECKMVTGRWAPAQRAWSNRLIQCGAIYEIAWYAERLTFAENVHATTVQIRHAIDTRCRA